MAGFIADQIALSGVILMLDGDTEADEDERDPDRTVNVNV